VRDEVLPRAVRSEGQRFGLGPAGGPRAMDSLCCVSRWLQSSVCSLMLPTVGVGSVVNTWLGKLGVVLPSPTLKHWGGWPWEVSAAPRLQGKP